MDNNQTQMQNSPCFPINSDTFTFNSAKLKSIQIKKLKSPFISSPLRLINQSPSEQIKESEGNNSQSSHLISPKDYHSLSFKEIQKPSPFINNPKFSSQSLNDFILSISSGSASSSRNIQKSPYYQIDSKEKQFLLPNTKYSSRYKEDYTIMEDPHEESFHLKQLKNNPRVNIPKKDYSENESKRMIKELLKLSNATNRIAEDYHINRKTLNKKDNQINNSVKEDKSQNKKGNDDNTCSTEDNEEELDEETKLFCFLSIPRIVHRNKKKQLMCFSLCSNETSSGNKFNQEAYYLTFKDIASMLIIEKIHMKSITLCERKANQQFIVQYINQKTFIKTRHTIETESFSDCLQYVKGINLLLFHRKIY